MTLTVKDIFKVMVKDIFKVTCTRIIQHIFSKKEWIYSLITKKQQFQQNTIIWPWGSRSFQSQGHIKFELRQDLIVIHILYKNHQDWRRNERSRYKVTYRFSCNSRAHNFGHTWLIKPIIELDWDLKVKHILHKNHHDWRRIESIRVVTRWI